MLANIRESFSEAEIGQIADQLINQLSHLHSRSLVLKYLNPLNIVVLQGFEKEEEIIV